MRKAQPKKRPSPGKRLFYGLLGAAIGGTIGYGFATSGSVAPPGLTVFGWTAGLALVCGAIAAASPDGFWRPARGWRFRR